MSEPGEPFLIYSCPHCQAELQLDGPVDLFMRCPECGEEFSLPIEATHVEQPVQHLQAQLTDELSGMRIQRIVVQRRAAIRLRSYFLLASFGCGGMAVTFLYRIGQIAMTKSPWTAAATIQLALAIVALAVAAYLLMRAHRLMLELNKPLLPEPEAPPDFSQLGDGSHHVRALEKMHQSEASNEPQMNADEF